jgi:uncharacterized membrane protein YedE/YeeE
MLLFNGRVAGISGILSEALVVKKDGRSWRLAFLGGLVVGGIVLQLFNSEVLTNTTDRSLGLIAFAGVLVGFGTVMGSGCTSGHGVCGISRFSLRSLVATVTFILFGILAVTFLRLAFGGQL